MVRVNLFCEKAANLRNGTIQEEVDTKNEPPKNLSWAEKVSLKWFFYEKQVV